MGWLGRRSGRLVRRGGCFNLGCVQLLDFAERAVARLFEASRYVGIWVGRGSLVRG